MTPHSSSGVIHLLSVVSLLWTVTVRHQQKFIRRWLYGGPEVQKHNGKIRNHERKSGTQMLMLLCFLICRCVVVFFEFPLCFALQGHSINDSTGVTFTELVYPEVYACICVCFLSAGITSLLGSGVYTAAYPLHDVSITCQHGHRKHSKCRWDNLARVWGFPPKKNVWLSRCHFLWFLSHRKNDAFIWKK